MQWWNSLETVSRIGNGLQIVGAVVAVLVVCFGLRLASLQKQSEWPSLTPQQISEWVHALSSCDRIELFDIMVGDSDGEKFSKSLRDVGQKLNWFTEIRPAYFKAGITIRSDTNEQATPIIMRLFQSIGCPATFEPLDGGNRNPRKVMIWIGEKP